MNAVVPEVLSRWLMWVAGVLAALLVFVVGVLGLAQWHTLSGSPPSSVLVDQIAHTRYPIVLAHGMQGFAYIKQQSYWRGIPEALRAHGAQVYVTQVSSFNSSEVRGEQLLAQVQQIMRETGAEKVNLIGHSHGSQSARYVAGLHPEWVASVTAVSGPTMGSEVADWIAELTQTHPWAGGALLGLGDAAGAVINTLSNQQLPIDARETMISLSTPGAALFNQRFPAGVPQEPCGEGAEVVNGVRYYSWSSVGRFYRALNAADYVMSLSGLAFSREADNDGLVGRCASHLGLVIKDDYPMNHFHTVNQFSGLVPAGIDPAGLYVEHAQRLKAAGL